MGRLTQIAPRVGGLGPRVVSHGAGPDRLARRDATVHWRAWYKATEWRRLRWAVLAAALFTCVRCGAFHGSSTSQLVCDHIRPHCGDRDAFFDRANLQCLCKACHDSAKQREERRGAPPV